jgi:hypothetical protein
MPSTTTPSTTTSTAMQIVFSLLNPSTSLTMSSPTPIPTPTPTRPRTPTPSTTTQLCQTFNLTNNSASSIQTTSTRTRTFQTPCTLTITNHFLVLSEGSNLFGHLHDKSLALSKLRESVPNTNICHFVSSIVLTKKARLKMKFVSAQNVG